MSWNIDVVLIANAGAVPSADLVPDVLTPQDARIGFDDATSVTRWSPPELCVSALGNWGVVTDVPCKLRGLVPYLQQQSTGPQPNHRWRPFMNALLLRYFNPDFLDEGLKAEASAPDMTGLDARLLSVRLTLELQRGDNPAATKAASSRIECGATYSLRR